MRILEQGFCPAFSFADELKAGAAKASNRAWHVKMTS
jgi:hypothetical protein